MQPRLSRDGAFLAFIDAQGVNGSGPAVRLHLQSRARRSTGFMSINAARVALSPSGRYYQYENHLADFDYGSYILLPLTEAGAFDATDTAMAQVRQEFVPMRQAWTSSSAASRRCSTVTAIR